MTTLFLATTTGLLVLRPQSDAWRAEPALSGLSVQCLAADPLQPSRLYCGTFGDGLWQSNDGGASWQHTGEGIAHDAVMSVAVSRAERVRDLGTVWAGTEPSAVFRSQDGGRTWQERPALRELPSAATWSFPPRPWTHHVRAIAPDAHEPERLFAGIELGGVMRSLDGGRTWEDHKPQAQPDAHALRVHPLAPGRVYEAAGGGYAESRDGGETWQRLDTGLQHRYVWGLAVDPGDPDIVLVSASPGPRQAHNRESAESHLYRKVGETAWQEVRMGLPSPQGVQAYVLATQEGEPGIVYATAGQEIYRSTDAGVSWERITVRWPTDNARPRAEALLITPD